MGGITARLKRDTHERKATDRRMEEPIQPEKASDWLLAMLERPEDEVLRRRFAAWLASDADNARAWDEVSRTYAVLGNTVPSRYAQWAREPERPPKARPMPDVDAAPVHENGRRKVRRARGRRRRRLVACAVAAMAACLAMIALPGVFVDLRADFTTNTAETRRIALADGSVVRLGPRSAIAIAYTEGRRDVRLLEGVAFFDVASDPERPFSVGADHIQATAVGTAFEVRVDDTGAGVAVREGVVRVNDARHDDGTSAVLRVGEWIRVSNAGERWRGALPPEHVASWIDGRLIVTDRTVEAVVDDLRRYYSGIVFLRGDHLAQEPLTGVYGLSDPASAVRAIAGAQGAAVYQLTPWVIVVSGE